MNQPTSISKKRLRYRQIHLDFHTSPQIKDIGKNWNKRHWQGLLQAAKVNSVTLFAKCHHGWSYHPSTVGKIHPHLQFDLLRAQYDACQEIGIETPIYLSAGVDNLASELHPEWREVSHTGQYTGWAKETTEAGFHKMCFHSPYVDYLCDQIQEVIALFPECNGIFLDIISSDQSCSPWALKRMLKEGLNPESEIDRKQADKLALERYYTMTSQAAIASNPQIHMFHNSGHIDRNNLDVLKYVSHLELESLPTGGWGYDHFPISVKFTNLLDLDVVGMTGKFHTTWGEFGGYKHPNALRYECSAMLAFGSKCSIGDQLCPNGLLDESTYKIIGEAYRDVAKKELWCKNATTVAEIGVLSSESEHGNNLGHLEENTPDTGAGRVLLEEHFLFDLIHREIDFSSYKLIILPDDIRIDGFLQSKIETYVTHGGKVLLTGESGLLVDSEAFAWDLGVEYSGVSPFDLDYVLPISEISADFVNSPLVCYRPSKRIRALNHNESLGTTYDPWFNRSWDHFCSHQHAPAKDVKSSFDCGVHHKNFLYLAHPIFSIYCEYGAVAYRKYIANCIRRLLKKPQLETNLPSTARVNLTHQSEFNRSILHLLHANTISRGRPIKLSGGTLSQKSKIEIIEDIIPLHDTDVQVRIDHPVERVILEPQHLEIDHTNESGVISLRIDHFASHQMIVFHETL